MRAGNEYGTFWSWQLRKNKMRKKEICSCGTHIDAARRALELETCERCGSVIPGNILRTVDPTTRILDATLLALEDKGNAPVPSPPPDNRLVRCVVCNTIFRLTQPHICSKPTMTKAYMLAALLNTQPNSNVVVSDGKGNFPPFKSSDLSFNLEANAWIIEIRPAPVLSQLVTSKEEPQD